MFNKQGKSLMNVYALAGIIFVVVLFIVMIKTLGGYWLEKDLEGDISLTNDSIDYLGQINKINTTKYHATKEQLEDPIVGTGNATGGNTKDFALEFFWSQEKYGGLINFAKTVYDLPSLVIVDIFRLPAEDFRWLIDTVVYFLTIVILIMALYIIRGLQAQ